MSELLSMRAYARRRGVSAMAVSKAAKAGRITLTEGMVDPATADRDWPANTNPGQAALRAVATSAGVEATATQEAAEAEPRGGNGGGDPPRQNGGHGAQYGQARAIREGYLARLAKLDYEKETGSLVPADTVRVQAFKAARAARESLISIPERLAPVLAGESNPFEVHRLLTEEIKRVCDELSHAKPF